MARPRSISKDDTLDRALLLFWERGYERTSIADLSESIGVGPSSLYNTFGSKEELFRQAIEHYLSTYASPALGLINDSTNQDAVGYVRDLMRGMIKLYTTRGLPAGCAVFEAAGAGSPQASSACATTADVKESLRTALRKRFEALAKAGASLSSPPKTLASFVLATLRGISQLARDGTSRAELQKIAEHAALSCVTPPAQRRR